MWRRVLSLQLKTLASHRSASAASRFASSNRAFISPSPSASLFHRYFTADAGAAVKKRVEDVMPIATGHEREELEAQLEEAPAVVKSYYDKRIVGCPGGEGEDEHDVVWFWLEKGKPHECPVCTQYFALEVVGPGGPPDGHGDDDHH
ncbi:cytochrome c oxidase subunit 5b-1, mitochondrial isoform X4 [Manihot esculenta]|uniref:cytochrome c oxidase subunit 5b-1, mitochondrial isoform X4 n=1 Tax=Manihot esculenta TaxID=3983 RepID=UPI001CC57037|nr:cytochrome c oxidase subunit 5b-1, mitochondrial isoform X4 [Manihot esculenta]